MGTPRPKPKSLSDVVPLTQFTARDLCRVTRAYCPPQVGMIVSRDGAWDHKYVIQEVREVVRQVEFVLIGSYRLVEVVTFEIKVMNLGKFNSDNRVRPASRFNPSTHTVKFVAENWQQVKTRGDMILGWPIGESSPPSKQFSSEHVDSYSVDQVRKIMGYAEFQALTALEQYEAVLAHKAQSSADWQEKHEQWLASEAGQKFKALPKSGHPQPKRSPEAILADFIIK